jgi:hypothetical protein
VDDANGSNQHWQLIDAGNGYYKIKNTNSGLILDVSGGSTTAGAKIIQWTDKNANNQLWQLVKVN